MTRLIAAFASVIFILNFSACSIRKDEEASVSNIDGASARKGTQSISIQAAQAKTTDTKPASAPVSAPEVCSDEPSPTNKIIDNNSITIIPQQDNKIIITYPKYEINQSDILPNDKNYTLTLRFGDYSDPNNAITTFLLDLYMKQSICYENVHRTIPMQKSSQSFINTLYSMEKLILNLGLVDVMLALPKLKYDDDGAPYVFQNAAAYKTTQDNIIRFGNTCQSEEFKQVTKGSFDTKHAILYFEAITTTPDQKHNATYFEVMKTSDDVFIYRSLNIYNGKIQSLFVSISDELMQAGFSEGTAAETFVYTPLSKTPNITASDEAYSLKPAYYLFANEAGAMIASSDKALKK